MLAESRHKIKSLHLGMARMVEAFPSTLLLSLLQVSFSLGYTDYLREFVLSDLGWQSCSGLLVPQQDPREQRVLQVRFQQDTAPLSQLATNLSCRGRLGISG